MGRTIEMRLSRLLPLAALLALASPALAEDAAPAAGEDQAAPAVTRAPNPAGVSDTADKTLWCGNAFVQSADDVRASGDAQTADAMLKDGNALVAQGTDMLAKSGFDTNKIDATKAAYDTQVKGELAGDPANARYSYEECLVLIPDGGSALPAPADSDEEDSAPAQ
jgi:hypothetical protein